MDTASASVTPSSRSRLLRWGGVLLLGLGLLGHLYAAHLTGGSRVAYTHHVLGFGMILVVTGGVIAGVGYRFWRSRRPLALLVIGGVQALIGLWIAFDQYRRSAGP